MAAKSQYPGDYCRSSSLTTQSFTDSNLEVKISNVSKGIIFELNLLRKQNSIPWIKFYDLVKAVCDPTFTISFNNFKVMIGRLEKKRCELTRNKRAGDIDILFSEPFCSSHHKNTVVQVSPEELNLAEEKSKIHTKHTSLPCLQRQPLWLNEKAKAECIKNIALIAPLDTLERNFSLKVAELEKKIEILITEIEVARYERDVLREQVSDLKVSTIRTKDDMKIVDGVCQCCVELLSLNVAVSQVEPVIRSVLRNIASIEVGDLPMASTLSGILAEMKC